MSRGGIYEGPDGDPIHGDGREVESASVSIPASQFVKGEWTHDTEGKPYVIPDGLTCRACGKRVRWLNNEVCDYCTGVTPVTSLTDRMRLYAKWRTDNVAAVKRWDQEDRKVEQERELEAATGLNLRLNKCYLVIWHHFLSEEDIKHRLFNDWQHPEREGGLYPDTSRGDVIVAVYEIHGQVMRIQ
jgi:hypothetical protein